MRIRSHRPKSRSGDTNAMLLPPARRSVAVAWLLVETIAKRREIGSQSSYRSKEIGSRWWRDCRSMAVSRTERKTESNA